MVRHAEVAVVGAGMFGSAAAKYLTRAGADTIVIGPAHPAYGTTARLPEYGAHQDESRIARCLGWDRFWGTVDTRSTARYRDIEAESGISFFHECGSLALAATLLGDHTRAMLSTGREDGVVVERLSDAEVRGEFPELCPPPIAGGVDALLERKNAGYINPRRLVRSQLKLAAAAGARLLRGSVTSVRRDEKTGLGRVRGEGATGGPLSVDAERILVAAGALINHNDALSPRATNSTCRSSPSPTCCSRSTHPNANVCGTSPRSSPSTPPTRATTTCRSICCRRSNTPTADGT
ncbi:NAD(P)/FAD-dependent oxidoreductase [Streptomyces melanogenes]|uniref:FAD-dependent oxidoreductase n=1 Tax=Streptomyces melanogenes TaxID=67326 RepID=A0ABZ1XDS7_9ACTN|nr:FAD-dependent oxidoreductase [Streptomyces melanogenes]